MTTQDALFITVGIVAALLLASYQMVKYEKEIGTLRAENMFLRHDKERACLQLDQCRKTNSQLRRGEIE